MIIVQLNGGLGNQFFQYALGRRLSHERNEILRFDLSVLQSPYSIRQYKLGYFQVYGRPLLDKEHEHFYGYRDSRLLRIFKLLQQQSLPYYRQKIVNEKTLLFDANILRVPSNVLLQGYWQTEKYFLCIRDILQNELQLKKPLDPVNLDLFQSIQNRNSVSIHIRHGDYLSNPDTNKTHGVLPLSYYQRAIELVSGKVDNPHFYVFSDDIPWARENLAKVKNIHFIDHNDSTHDYFDFALMTACKFHIIANSSFSWWAAWLSVFPEKIIVAPQQWYQIHIDSRDLIPLEWIRL